MADPDEVRAMARVLAGVIGAQEELDRQAHEGELFYRDEDSFVDGRLDLGALVRAILAQADRVA